MSETNPINVEPGPAGPRKFVRSTTDRWLGGVCGGIGQYFDISPNVVRLLFVVSVLLPGPQFLLYLLLWLVVPAQ